MSTAVTHRVSYRNSEPPYFCPPRGDRSMLAIMAIALIVMFAQSRGISHIHQALFLKKSSTSDRDLIAVCDRPSAIS